MFLLPLLISLLCVLFHQDMIEATMIWNRELIYSGEWWRIVTGNFTHTNLAHLAMNLAGLWLITSIFKPKPSFQLCSIGLLSIGVGIAILLSDINIYLGMSGVLHGMFACWALGEALNNRRSSWLLVLGIGLKVGWENTLGTPSATADLIQANVAVEAHLAGLILGLFIATVYHFVLKSGNRKAKD
ncbi:rhombosortase [Vibrio maerlii]|uniref:rhombosortase n=1 Tax=Vibrio maerlii TaxID=2231648 RepID=UPI001F13C4DE|nr:rhombosortase [Vibrio maerlii]